VAYTCHNKYFFSCPHSPSIYYYYLTAAIQFQPSQLNPSYHRLRKRQRERGGGGGNVSDGRRRAAGERWSLSRAGIFRAVKITADVPRSCVYHVLIIVLFRHLLAVQGCATNDLPLCPPPPPPPPPSSHIITLFSQVLIDFVGSLLGWNNKVKSTPFSPSPPPPPATSRHPLLTPPPLPPLPPQFTRAMPRPLRPFTNKPPPPLSHPTPLPPPSKTSACWSS
jgi:hypothetical protein